jgi:hypothetical protein
VADSSCGGQLALSRDHKKMDQFNGEKTVPDLTGVAKENAAVAPISLAPISPKKNAAVAPILLGLKECGCGTDFLDYFSCAKSIIMRTAR